jgi:hypothetical protein
MKTREKLLFVYTQALDQGDIDTVSRILAQAEDDPVLGTMVVEINRAIENDLAHQSSEIPPRVIPKPIVIPRDWKSRFVFAAAMVAVIAAVLLIFGHVTDLDSCQPAQTVAFVSTQEVHEQYTISFEAEVTSVDALLLMTRSEQVPVRWRLEPVPPQARVVFAQVIPNNALLSTIERSQTRFNDGAGHADLAPILPASDAEAITLLIQALDPVSGQLYASRAIMIPIQAKTETVTPIEDDENCDEEPFAPSAGLAVNETSTVKSEMPLPLYNSSGIGNELSGFVAPEETVMVLDGPFCFFTANDGAYVRQWFVRSEATAAEGWLFEAYNSRQISSPAYFLYKGKQ